MKVQKRIFIFNTLIVLTALILFLIVNAAIIEMYEIKHLKDSEYTYGLFTEEVEVSSVKNIPSAVRHRFVLMFLLDGLGCIVALLAISEIFTRKLILHIMEPLNKLDEAAERVKNGNLNEKIEYYGDEEFQEVCNNFNAMQDALRLERERSQRYEKSRTDMVAGISHDLRTPLTAIRGTIKGLMDGVASDPLVHDKFLKTAYRRTGEMDELLQQLFYFSKLETGNMPLRTESIELNSYISNYITAKKFLYPQITFDFTFATERLCAVIDPEQMIRVLDNLMQNSIKYAEVSDLRIVIALNSEDDRAVLIFKDNGNGVAEDKLPHLFEEFYRGDVSRNKKDGNGLGLYIVKYLIEAMSGSVRAFNDSGFGIEIKIPLEENK